MLRIYIYIVKIFWIYAESILLTIVRSSTSFGKNLLHMHLMAEKDKGKQINFRNDMKIDIYIMQVIN